MEGPPFILTHLSYNTVDTSMYGYVSYIKRILCMNVINWSFFYQVTCVLYKVKNKSLSSSPVAEAIVQYFRITV